MSNYTPIFLARVNKIGLGSTGLGITIKSEVICITEIIVYPILDGLLKLPAPQVNDIVLILQVDSSNLIRFYIPIRQDFSNLVQNATNIQIESAGKIEMDGIEIDLGVNAMQFVVLATLMAVIFNAHVHAYSGTAVVAGVTGTSAGSTAVPTVQITASQIAATKVKAE
jgi:hypothetical protein